MTNSKDVKLIDVENVSWIPPNSEEPLWKDVEFSINAGELLILDGPSGSGKSTLLRSLVLLQDVSSGQIRWRGDVVSSENIRSFRHRVVYVHQSPVPIASTVDENMRFPRRMSREFGGHGEAMTEEEQRELLHRFGLVDVDFSRRFDEFSVGEQQRLALVRCMSVRPEVLLLDEPTASLDDKSAGQVEEYILDFVEKAGGAVIWVSHNREQRQRLAGRELNMKSWLARESS